MGGSGKEDNNYKGKRRKKNGLTNIL